MIVNLNDNIGSILNTNYEVLHQNLHQIKNNFMVYEKEEQLTESNIRVSYDNVCKRILSQKSILSWIMKACISEYKDESIEDIKNKYIEGMPQISTERVHAEDIADVIIGMNTEDAIINEGYITYDIKYKALLPNSKKKASLIINIEAQNDRNPSYSILKRAMFYCSRMISSQKGQEFTNQDYDKINKVYSIWLFTTPFKSKPTSITEYKMGEHCIVGDRTEEKENYDLMDIMTVYLGNDNDIYENNVNIDNDDNTIHEFINLMKVLFTNETKRNRLSLEKMLDKKYGITINKKFREELIDMCNLSEGVYESGRMKGLEQGILQGMQQGIAEGISKGISKRNTEVAINMLKLNMDVQTISDITSLSIFDVMQLKDKYDK